MTLNQIKSFPSSVFDMVDQYARSLMQTGRYPGLAVGLTDRQQLLWTGAYGFADLAARLPVTPETLFETGSIGKSFTSLALFQLQDEGRLDIHDPVTRYLPWFQVQSKFNPIEIFHLLTHTAGIVGGSDFSPESFMETWALRNTRAGCAPGEFFHYSNTGYKALGLLLEAVTGQSYEHAIRTRILDPLGMNATAAAITHDTRRRMATGYCPFYDDRPDDHRSGFVPATWFETATGDGCLASNVIDMAAYLRLYLNGGSGLVSAASFKRMTQGVILAESEDNMFYGCGIASLEKEDHLYLGHTGGMVGYVSEIRADLTDGFGVVQLVNGLELPEALCNYCLALLSAARSGQSLPPPPPIPDPAHIPDAAHYAGTYTCGDRVIMLQAQADHLVLLHGTDTIVLEVVKPDYFLVPHRDFNRFLFHIRRGDQNAVLGISYGPDEYARAPLPEHPGGVPVPQDVLPEFQVCTGHYRNYNPWYSNFRVVARQGVLILIHRSGMEEDLVPLGEGVFRIGKDARLPEQIHFHTVVDGKAQVATLAGSDYFRAFTP